jgi:Fanconi anemia group M protein
LGGLLQWSPGELLKSREKFRQAPPPDFPQFKYGEIEGCFGVLLTGYHILKLLSSHGIRPAYEMLEEKLKQGYVLVHYPFLHCLDHLIRKVQ